MTLLDDNIRAALGDAVAEAPSPLTATEILGWQSDLRVVPVRPARRFPLLTVATLATAAAVVVAVVVAARVRHTVGDPFTPSPVASGLPITTDTLAGSIDTPAPTTTVPLPPTSATRSPLVAGDVVGRLDVPRMELVTDVVEGDPEPTVGVTRVVHRADTPLPEDAVDQPAVIIGPRTTYGAEMDDLDRVLIGDRIDWTAATGETLTLVVIGWDVLPAEAATGDVAAPQGTTLVLLAPHPRFSTQQRLAVYAAPALPDSPTAANIPPTTTIPPEQQVSLADIEAHVTEALRTLDSFSATVTLHGQTLTTAADGTSTSTRYTRTNSVTMQGNGRMWVDTGDGGWASFEPSTGESRLKFAGANGGWGYQEILGWTDNSVGIKILLGHDPVLNFANLPPDAVASETTYDARPSWEIIAGDDTYLIDRATGLVVHHTHISRQPGGLDVPEESDWTDLLVGVELPPEFPGTFPTEAAVDRSGAAFDSLTIDEAASRFGVGFVIPADLDPQRRISLSEVPLDMDRYDMMQTRLTIVWTTGFLRTELEILKDVTPPGAIAPDGWAIVEGAECPSEDGVTCATATGPSAITAGDLVGVPSSGSAGLGINDASRRIRISSPSAETTLAIANSLIRYTPDV